MAFFKPTLVDVPFAEYQQLPFKERIRLQSIDWARNGFGAPSSGIFFYVVKIAAWALLGLWISCSTSGLGSMWQISNWWAEPIIYQKLVLWAMLWEVLSLGAASGPATFHFLPPIAGIIHWLTPGTMRRPPWGGKVPGTAGYRRTLLDVLLYIALIAVLAVGLGVGGEINSQLVAALPESSGLVLAKVYLLLPLIPLILLGLRDYTPFLAARAEQYAPALFFGVIFTPVDFMIACKVLICSVWIGAAIGKIGPHFTLVIPPMMSNTPWMISRRLNEAFYRNVPHDLRPSKLAFYVGHVLGTAVELGSPLLLLFVPDKSVALVAATLIIGMHVVITSTMPLAVPLEWNIHFIFLTVFLFFGFPTWDGFAVWNLSSPLVGIIIAVVLLTFPVLGNVRPDLVSFLPSMRQYAGNWATTMWAFKPEALERMYRDFPAAGSQEKLLTKFFGEEASIKLLEKVIAWRCMHSQGRGLVSALMKHLGPDCEGYVLREGENIGGWALGWNFGDGHLHGPQFMADMQRILHFEPGDVVAVFAESQPIHRHTQRYQIVDLAKGTIESGHWDTRDTSSAQPWLPEGPIALIPDPQPRS